MTLLAKQRFEVVTRDYFLGSLQRFVGLARRGDMGGW